jgi:hypothetical protein
MLLGNGSACYNINILYAVHDISREWAKIVFAVSDSFLV